MRGAVFRIKVEGPEQLGLLLLPWYDEAYVPPVVHAFWIDSTTWRKKRIHKMIQFGHSHATKVADGIWTDEDVRQAGVPSWRADAWSTGESLEENEEDKTLVGARNEQHFNADFGLGMDNLTSHLDKY
ncbi:hypothetical protein CORC01_14055 [Colletotrichum orchidophilum]|uniref:Uncharacterized protein n=1 Tax=Colletotrichum orchidophilum TaxID=1209926 RepID=A0A1G4ANG1_9PEZI|nr:uncharacterized protein CORC01_14055 [Colletotrichum orchidophilum]OHE90636.1 hypothetical protein CORC01_14055 [Colletotrichum orchidophilum]